MKPIEIITETKTRVTYNGNDVNELLKEMCDAFHSILMECSRLTQKIDDGEEIDRDEFLSIEGECCTILDLLED